MFFIILDSTSASQTLSVPEEEEEEEQEEDDDVPDLTGFVLDDMKQYAHLDTLWSLDISEADTNIFIIV